MGSNGLGVFLEALPLGEVRRFARLADACGWQNAWFPEITFGDAFVPAAAAALETSRLCLATGVVGIWSRSPVAMALTAASLSQLCPGRMILGLGLQARSYVEDWHGARYAKTLTAMREYVTILRRILGGESVTFEGEVFRVRNFQLQVLPPDPPVPIYLAAIGPKMAHLAGEMADGILGYFYSLPYLSNVVVPNIRAGAARAGRSLDHFDIACGLPAIVSRDDRALEQIKGQVLMFATAGGSSPYYAESFVQAGYGNQVRQIQDLAARGELKRALRVVTDDMAAAFTLAGTPEYVRRRIAEYRAAGATTVVLNPSPPDVYFPLFQGHFPDGAEMPPFSFPAYLKVIGDAIELMGGESPGR
ncbi:MAG TPA: LLM class flavin-dependent oxidoreductase [Terriglobales bacterium]|nr:LLM class flavin-dependent oxidoreductase [Terriglobales bacterium]